MEFLQSCLRELIADRRRVGLVALGVVWGTLGLTVLLAFGTAMTDAMNVAKHGEGRHLLRFGAGATTRPFEGLPAGRSITLEPEDAALLAASIPALRGVSAEFSYSGRSLERGEVQINGRVHGVDSVFGELRNFWPEPGGRFLNNVDVQQHRAVAFLGHEIRDRLFGAGDPIGQTILIASQPFTVVGVMQPRTQLGNYNGHDRTKVLIPWTTFRDLFGWRSVSYLIAALHEPDDDTAAIAAVYATLGGKYRFAPSDRAALSLHNRVEDVRTVDGILAGNQIFTTIVGVLGLLVAIVGVANVMFVMVEERKREIGVQLALGATPRSIAAGRLIEGLVTTFAGGAVGIAASAGVLWGINQIPMDATARGYLGWPTVSLGIALAIAAILGLAGCVAGYYPARRAATLDPVEALREE